MSEFKPMVKMYTDEPSVSLKLKKGGKVHVKHHAKGGKEHGKHGHKAMHNVVAGHMHGAHHAFESEDGHAPKKPSMMERRKAMNPNLYKKGGKVAHKVMGGAMPMSGAMPMTGGMNPGAVPTPTGRSGGINPGAVPTPMGRTGVAAMAPAQRAARAAMVRKALTGMKKGGDVDHKMIEKLEKELHHHESLSMHKAHPQKKASGGAIDRDETRTTIEKGTKKFAKTKVDDGDHHDKHHGTKGIKDGAPAGYKHGGHAHKKHHKATGGAIPADTDEKMNKGKTKFGGTIEDNEHDFENTEMHQAKRDNAHGTGGVRMSNAGGFKHGGKAHHKMHHKASGGMIDRVETRGGSIEHDGDWENRAANTSKPGKSNTRTGEVKEANAGGYKRGGHASKKAFATGGNVVDSGKAEKMPRHFVSRPVANSLQSGTFKTGGGVKKLAKGGRAEKEEKPNLRLMSTHTGPKGHVAKVYKDKEWGEHRVRFYSPEGKHYPEDDYHTDDIEDAHDTAKYALNRYKHGGSARKC